MPFVSLAPSLRHICVFLQHVIKQFGNMNRIHHLLLFDTSFRYMYTTFLAFLEKEIANKIKTHLIQPRDGKVNDTEKYIIKKKIRQ